LYRRFSLYNQGVPYDALKTNVIQMYLKNVGRFSTCSSFALKDYRITLLYTDVDGDQITIETNEDLGIALRQHVGKRVIKIIASIEDVKSESDDSVSRASIATQTVHAAADAQSTPESILLQDSLLSQTAPTIPLLQATSTSMPTFTLESPSTTTSLQSPPPPLKNIVDTIVGHLTPVVVALTAQVQSGCIKASEAVERAAGTAETSTTTTMRYSEQLPFIHGRHTCDGCLTTPIVGKRYHSANLPDYDLCSECKDNYRGDELTFEAVELDNDRAFQARWNRRLSNWANGTRRGPHSRGCGRRGPGFRYCGPMRNIGPVAIHHGPSQKEVDLALKEAIRRSLQDLVPKGEQVSGANEEAAESQEPADQPTLSACVMTTANNMDVASQPDDLAQNETDGKVGGQTDVTHESKPESTMETVRTRHHDAEITSSELHESSFEEEAAGSGDVALFVGSCLDKFAQAIDDFNDELERKSSSVQDEGKTEILDQPDESSKKLFKGAEIIEAEEARQDDDDSQGSWNVVDEAFSTDEALAHATQAIGSALFNSDMVQSSEIMSTLSHSGSHAPSMSSNMSIPTTVSSIAPGTLSSNQMDRWVDQLNSLHAIGLSDDARLVEILERLTAANIGCDELDEISVERVVDAFYSGDT
jgi:hypothetical protein